MEASRRRPEVEAQASSKVKMSRNQPCRILATLSLLDCLVLHSLDCIQVPLFVVRDFDGVCSLVGASCLRLGLLLLLADGLLGGLCVRPLEVSAQRRRTRDGAPVICEAMRLDKAFLVPSELCYLARLARGPVQHPGADCGLCGEAVSTSYGQKQSEGSMRERAPVSIEGFGAATGSLPLGAAPPLGVKKLFSTLCCLLIVPASRWQLKKTGRGHAKCRLVHKDARRARR